MKGGSLILNMKPNDIQDKIEEYLPIRKEFKDKNGEVFTPPKLIDEILDKLPKNVWSNANLTWLDPANGIGNFPMIVYVKLMKGLESTFPDKTTRSEHIIKKMLYMVELSGDNVAVSKRIFGKDANISCGSFLNGDDGSEPKWKRQFGIDKFDIIMGNPPFQKAQDGTRKGGYGGNIPLWEIFIKECIKYFKNENSYLCFINPQAWRKPEHKLWEEMIQKRQLHFLKIISEGEGKKLFGADTKPDLYILQNKPIFKNTYIIDELGEKHNLDLKEWSFLPNSQFKNVRKILTTKENGINVLYDTKYHTQKPKSLKTVWWLSSKKQGKYIHPIVHTINQSGFKDSLWYTNNPERGHFKIPKVLLNFGRHQYPYNDFKGEYGMSQITFGIPISSEKEGDLIVKAINTPEFKEIIKATKWGAFQTDYRMFKYFKKDFWKEFIKNL